MNDHRLVRLLRKKGHEVEIAPQGHDSKIRELATMKCEPIVTKDVDFYKSVFKDRKKIKHGLIYVEPNWKGVGFEKFALQIASAIDFVVNTYDLTHEFITVTCFTPEGSTLIKRQIEEYQSEPLRWIWFVEQLVVTDSFHLTNIFNSVNQLEIKDEWEVKNVPPTGM